MAKVYADLVRDNVKTLDDVPERIRAEVCQLLGVTEWTTR